MSAEMSRMSPRYRNILALTVALALMKNVYSQETFLSFTVELRTGQMDILITREMFLQFHSCMCESTTRSCELVFSPNGQVTNVEIIDFRDEDRMSQFFNRTYVCERYDAGKLGCRKVHISAYCWIILITKSCYVYDFVDKEMCALGEVMIASNSILRILAVNTSTQTFRYKDCEQKCAFTPNVFPMVSRTTITPSEERSRDNQLYAIIGVVVAILFIIAIVAVIGFTVRKLRKQPGASQSDPVYANIAASLPEVRNVNPGPNLDLNLETTRVGLYSNVYDHPSVGDSTNEEYEYTSPCVSSSQTPDAPVQRNYSGAARSRVTNLPADTVERQSTNSYITPVDYTQYFRDSTTAGSTGNDSTYTRVVSNTNSYITVIGDTTYAKDTAVRGSHGNNVMSNRDSSISNSYITVIDDTTYSNTASIPNLARDNGHRDATICGGRSDDIDAQYSTVN